MTGAGPTARAGDLGPVFARLRTELRSFLRKRLPDAAAADDLLQDVFVKALASRRAGRPIDNITGWLYSAARTTLADYFRSAGKPTTAVTEDIAEPESEAPAMHQALAACLRPLVDTLPPLYRDVLIATDLDGATMRSVAEAEGISVSAIKSRAARGRAMLRDAVLACCAVEVEGGLVSDFRRRRPTGCGTDCT